MFYVCGNKITKILRYFIQSYLPNGILYLALSPDVFALSCIHEKRVSAVTQDPPIAIAMQYQVSILERSKSSAFSTMNALRGGTSSPMSRLKIWLAC